jgi:hypothetical protein
MQEAPWLAEWKKSLSAEIGAIGTDSGLVETRVYRKQCQSGRDE